MSTYRRIYLFDDMKLDDRSRRRRSKRVGLAAFKFWRGLSATLKPRYRVPYNAAMNIEVRGDVIRLTLAHPSRGPGRLVRAVEYGYGSGGYGTTGPYDMRTTLLKSKKTRTTKSGARVLSVPMRVTRRQMTAWGGGSWKGYRAAQQLSDTVRMSPTHTVWGKSLSDPSHYARKLQPRARNVPGIGHVPAHKTDPMAGLYKFRGSKGQTSYGTFRTISSRGKPWVHPGISAARLLRKTADHIHVLAKEMT